jgi:hypothetical protein
MADINLHLQTAFMAGSLQAEINNLPEAEFAVGGREITRFEFPEFRISAFRNRCEGKLNTDPLTR